MKGVPYNVTVFASNGKGNSSIVSMVAYAEEDGKCVCALVLSLERILSIIMQFQTFQVMF